MAEATEKFNDNHLPLFLLSPETKPTPNGLGSVLSQIVLCKSMKPDFNAEEKVSIDKDTREIRSIIAEMAECLPKEDPDKGKERVHSKGGYMLVD